MARTALVYCVPAGTEVSVFRLNDRAIRDGYKTKTVHYFTTEDVVFTTDSPTDRERGMYTVYGTYARAGFVGFRSAGGHRGFVLMVPKEALTERRISASGLTAAPRSVD